jgi:hypothetical protein
MEGSRPKQIKRETAVWVWDGSWWPAVVIDGFIDRGERLLIVRFEHGVTAPARAADLEPREPNLRGADKPRTAVDRQSDGQSAAAESKKLSQGRFQEQSDA